MKSLRCLLVSLAALAGLALLPGAAGANVINVTMTTDQFAGTPGSGCSLRDAFNGAVYGGSLGDCEMSGADDTIKLPTGSYELTIGPSGDGTANSGDLDMAGSDPVTIEPAGPGDVVVINGSHVDRVFDHLGAGIGDLILRNLTITGGFPGAGPVLNGGAVRTNDGLVRAEGVTFFGNSSGEDGGAIAVGNGASFEAVNSTFTENSAPGSGGGIWAANLGAFIDLRNVTISANTADSDADGFGSGGGLSGGIGDSTVNMTNSILAENIDASPDPADKAPDCVSNANFFPRYVISTQQLGTGECFVTLPAPDTNQSPVADAGLESFADNGGPTPTVGLAADSPAIEAGGSTFPDICLPTDQRGVARPDGHCDLGAFQFTAPLPGAAGPVGEIAVFDGTNLYIRLKCPARFRPKCRSTTLALTRRNGGRAMTRPKGVVTRSGRYKVVRLTVKPAYRSRIAAMTYVDRRQLVVRQKIRSKRIRARKAPRRPATIFHTYKVRVRT
ncbi:MAG: hypothetical protein KDB52_05195 [Solirubrobacterales bacterium]|nr:hypothetical protein [Solirubrobacterales bacterium]